MDVVDGEGLTFIRTPGSRGEKKRGGQLEKHRHRWTATPLLLSLYWKRKEKKRDETLDLYNLVPREIATEKEIPYLSFTFFFLVKVGIEQEVWVEKK